MVAAIIQSLWTPVHQKVSKQSGSIHVQSDYTIDCRICLHIFLLVPEHITVSVYPVNCFVSCVIRTHRKIANKKYRQKIEVIT